jgi:hypothetical protein
MGNSALYGLSSPEKVPGSGLRLTEGDPRAGWESPDVVDGQFSVIFIGVTSGCGPRELVPALQWTHQSGHELPWSVSRQGSPAARIRAGPCDRAFLGSAGVGRALIVRFPLPSRAQPLRLVFLLGEQLTALRSMTSWTNASSSTKWWQSWPSATGVARHRSTPHPQPRCGRRPHTAFRELLALGCGGSACRPRSPVVTPTAGVLSPSTKHGRRSLHHRIDQPEMHGRLGETRLLRRSSAVLRFWVTWRDQSITSRDCMVPCFVEIWRAG